MESNEKKREWDEQHKEYVRMQRDMGVPPLELRYRQINSCQTKTPIAYRTSTLVNSVVRGVMQQSEYNFAANTSQTGIRLAEWNVLEAFRHIKRFGEAGRNVDWIAVKCPDELALKKDLYEWMGELIERVKPEHPEKLCLEFSQSILSIDEERARLAVLDMKLHQVKTLMTGCAADDCPISKLAYVPFDYVMLDPRTTSLTNSRNKPTVVPTLINYLKSMNLGVIADGAEDDDMIRAMSGMECYGYQTAKNYQGTSQPDREDLSVTEAMEQKEEREE